MTTETPSQDCPQCGRFVQDRPNVGLHCECGWKRLRGAVGLPDLQRRMDEAARPFPLFLGDHDEYHRRTRERLLSYHEGPPQGLTSGAYGLEPGDRITYRRKVWRVLNVTRWESGNGHTLTLDHDGHTMSVEVAWTFRSGYGPSKGERVELLTSPHYPVCGDCGQPWPCQTTDESFDAVREVERLLAGIAQETEYPVPCPKGCPSRFKTERGARQHIARSRRHRSSDSDLETP